MNKVPVFPIPGHGRYMRQPLYVGDFCSVIIGCIEDPSITGVYNISGHEEVDYIDIIREMLFARMIATVLTSATLSVDGRFDYVRGRLGIRSAHDRGASAFELAW